MPDSSVPLGHAEDPSTSPKGITALDTPAGPTEEDTDVRATRRPETPPTESDKIIDAIHVLCETNGRESNSLKVILKRLNTAVEALKQQPQSNDRETAFWTAYQKLAAEYDAELQKKYGNNLDTSLIFAGLFSAVSSAFIIQIQPELQTDPNPTIQTNLLQLLVQNITGAAVPGIQMAGQTVRTTTTITVVAQSLLYFSLFSTLFAALLAVLGKQWLLNYDSVSKRGTIKERGLERQRKVDGLRRWKFDPVMQILSLLLQLSLLLFAVGLSFYLWTIHPVIASMVLGLTAIGFILYFLTVISSMVSPDSPFQTSLSVLLQTLVQRISLSRSLKELFQQSCASAISFLLGIPSAISTCMKSPLPQFHARTYQEPLSPAVSVFIFDKIPESSQDISAIIWVLETSTDPQLVEVAAAVVPELQWPVNLNLEPSLKKLADAFQGCFDGWNVREGMDDRALSCIKAFGVLEMVSEQHSVKLLTLKPNLITTRNKELASLLRFFHIDNFQNPWSTPAIYVPLWGLRFISARRLPQEYLEAVLNYFEPDEVSLQNPLLCAEFLFCINSFFSRPGRSDLSLLDKSGYCGRLMLLLFENLVKSLTGVKPSDPRFRIAESIVNKAAQFPCSIHNAGRIDRCRQAVYKFCAMSGLNRKTKYSALRIVELAIWLPPPKIEDKATLEPPQNVSWVYSALQENRDIVVVGDLLQVLFLCIPVQSKPTSAAVETIIWAISSEAHHTHIEDPNMRRMKFLAFHILCSAKVWFEDNNIGPILGNNNAWKLLGAFCMHTKLPTSSAYTSLSDSLVRTPGWETIISNDRVKWLQLLPRLFGDYGDDESRSAFCFVLAHIWPADEHKHDEFEQLKPLAMAFDALADFWDKFNFWNSAVDKIINLIECSISTSFCARVVGVTGNEKLQDPCQKLNDTILVSLGSAIEKALDKAKQAAIRDSTTEGHIKELLNCAGDLLGRLVKTILGELRYGRPNSDAHNHEVEELKYWKNLRARFNEDLDIVGRSVLTKGLYR